MLSLLLLWCLFPFSRRSNCGKAAVDDTSQQQISMISCILGGMFEPALLLLVLVLVLVLVLLLQLLVVLWAWCWW
jgi:hypothetical protein